MAVKSNLTAILFGLCVLNIAVGTEALGVTKVIITAGDGVNFPKKGQVVSVHQIGTLPDGTQFDSSRDRGKPFQFKIGVGKVIKGWDEGIAQMSKGERAKLTITPDYGYGARGYPGRIPPNSVLIYDVELLTIG